jgi:hypothetical protein
LRWCPHPLRVTQRAFPAVALAILPLTAAEAGAEALVLHAVYCIRGVEAVAKIRKSFDGRKRHTPCAMAMSDINIDT